jgi:ATP-binding cassette subfamily B protein
LIAQPVRFLGFVILLTTQAVTSSRRVFEILDAPVEIKDRPDAVEMPPIQGHVRFEGVCFAYAENSEMVLHDVNLEAKPGQIIALLGQTGSGKTSLVNLIPRFYEVSAGRITIDGIDIRDVRLVSLRRQIGVVLQESTLFSATIRENISYGRPDAGLGQVIAAAKAANAHDFIMEFPDGYEADIGERGVTLSGGQRQRVAIARALLIDPRILILDDSTSSVDTRTEFLIQEALNRLMEGRTTFVIAQRLTTVQNADQILVLDQGEIVERGAHQELLDQNGLYADIYRLQLADQERLKRELMALGGLLEENSKRSTGEFTVGVGQFSSD